MRYLYYCNSPYQLFNVINLNWQRKFKNFENIDNYQADLIILNAFNGASEIVNILSNEDMFSNVYLSNRIKNTNRLHRISTFLDFVFSKRYIGKVLKKNYKDFKNKYDYLEMPKVSPLMLTMWLLNKNARIQLYEEGFDSYQSGKHMCYEKNSHEWIYSLKNSGKKLINNYDSIYLNKKSLYLGDDIDKVIEIPTIDDKCLDKMNSLFSSLLFDDPNKNFIWVGQYLVDGANTITENELKKYEDDVIYIPHPRYKERQINSFNKIESNKFWELNISIIKDIENKCFITMHSTAAFSPKIVLNKEPFLILTLNMIQDEKNKIGLNEVNKIVERISKEYKDQSKIMLPKNEKELRACIETYLSKTNLV